MDCKKRQGRSEEEIRHAEEKFEESKRLAQLAMFKVLSNDVEQVSQLRAFVEAQLEYQKRSTQVLEQLHQQLCTRFSLFYFVRI